MSWADEEDTAECTQRLQFVTNSMSQVHHIHILNSDHMQFYFLMQMSDCSPSLMEGAVITRKPYLLHGL